MGNQSEKAYLYTQNEALKRFCQCMDCHATVDDMVHYLEQLIDSDCPSTQYKDGHEEWIKTPEFQRLRLSFHSPYLTKSKTYALSILETDIEAKFSLLYALPYKVTIDVDTGVCSKDWLTQHHSLSHFQVTFSRPLDWLPSDVDFYELAHIFPYVLAWRTGLQNIKPPLLSRDAIIVWEDEGFIFPDNRLKEHVFCHLLEKRNQEQHVLVFIEKHMNDHEKKEYINKHLIMWLSGSHNRFPLHYLPYLTEKSAVLVWSHSLLQEQHTTPLNKEDFPEKLQPVIEQYETYNALGFFKDFVSPDDRFKFFYAGGSKLLDKINAFYEKETPVFTEESPLW